ncbi:MAG: TRAP transporter large permease, partial [Alphaproteobacteria bacterium]|nr:TRAP transporter large permease [Alphaproteobacteria bacterium]
PLFILLGEIMLRAGIARRMYGAVIQWVSWLPGGLMHANIGSCTIFAASSGSSVATAATVGTVAYPEIEKRKYNERLFLGSLAAGGTLGILVPPSINLIIYGLLTDTSVPELYLAGILPGLILSGLFMVAIIGACIYRPSWGGGKIETNWGDRFRTLPDLLPPIVLFTAVVGSIYAGIATPTEAASIGVVVALIIAASFKSLNITMLRDAFEGTMRTNAMIMLIVFAAIFLNFVLGFMGITQAMLGFIADMGLSPVQTIYLIVVFYLLLGMFMETLSMMLTTIPIVFPIIMKLGVPEFSDVWFGILITLLMEAALITPPIGINLYVVQGIRTRGGKFNDVAIGAIPFVFAMLAMIVLLISFPLVATWLPNLVYH